MFKFKNIVFVFFSLFQRLTLDIIGSCALGLQTNAQTDINDPFITNIRTLFRTINNKVILSVVSKLPFLYLDYPEKPLELKTIILQQTTTSSASDTDWKELPRMQFTLCNGVFPSCPILKIQVKKYLRHRGNCFFIGVLIKE